MGIYDRDYTADSYRPNHGGGRMRMNFPRITPMVKRLLIINIVVFFVQILSMRMYKGQMTPIDKWFSVYPVSLVYVLQIWRLITYQFLHGH